MMQRHYRRHHVQRIVLGILVLLTVVLCVGPSVHQTIPAMAQSLPATSSYQANSPHWSHINVADFGSLLKRLPEGSVKQAGYEWYARHVDFMNVGMANWAFEYRETQSAEMKAINPSIKTFGYATDITICQHKPCSYDQPANTAQNALPENQYLHYSEDTQLKFIGLDGKTVVRTITVPGCPESEEITPACRVQVYVWNDDRWVPNLKNTAWQEWQANKLIEWLTINSNNTPNPIDDVFLDEHGPGFSLAMGIGSQTIILSGGGIREYGGLVPHQYSSSSMDPLDTAFNDDVVDWLTYLQSRLTAVGKSMHINTAEYFMYPLGFDQAVAAKGTMTEWLHSPDHFRFGASMYQQFLDQVHQMTSTGATIDLAYSWCTYEPDGYTAGNYPTAIERYRMWNLASYYMAREFPGEPGVAYFNSNLCINPSAPNPLDFQNEWLLAYEKDVGQPIDTATRIQHGSAGSCSSQEYGIFARHYTNAYVLVRPRDDYWCQDYGDATAVSVPLDHPMAILESDGTFSEPMNSVLIRNGEAVILMTPPDTTPPGAVQDLRAVL